MLTFNWSKLLYKHFNRFVLITLFIRACLNVIHTLQLKWRFKIEPTSPRLSNGNANDSVFLHYLVLEIKYTMFKFSNSWKNSLILQNYVGPIVEYYCVGVKSVWPMFETYSYPLVDWMILTVLHTVVSRWIPE